jgi:hypothetical protein
MFALEKKLVRSTEVICLACSFISYIGQVYTRADQATVLFHIINTVALQDLMEYV